MLPPSHEGNSDWYCERAWVEESAETGHRDRHKLQEELGADKEKLNGFLKRRQKIVERTQQKLGGKYEKRRGGSTATGRQISC